MSAKPKDGSSFISFVSFSLDFLLLPVSLLLFLLWLPLRLSHRIISQALGDNVRACVRVCVCVCLQWVGLCPSSIPYKRIIILSLLAVSEPVG